MPDWQQIVKELPPLEAFLSKLERWFLQLDEKVFWIPALGIEPSLLLVLIMYITVEVEDKLKFSSNCFYLSLEIVVLYGLYSIF